AGRGQLQVPDRQPPEGVGPPRRHEPRRPGVTETATMADPAPIAIDDDTLRAYLAESLPGEELARVERALRGSAMLRQRLEAVRHDRPESAVHPLGAIWRRARLSCPDREELG